MTVAEQMKNTSGSASQQLLTSTKIKEGMNMANRSSNTAAVPEAKGALDKLKFEVASELGVPLSDGYNGNLTSKQNGSVGGYMVKKMIEQQERQMSGGSSGQYYSSRYNILMPEQASKSVSSFLFGKAHAFFLLLQSCT